MKFRLFDIFLSWFALVVFTPVIITLVIISSADTSSTGIFKQKRVGQYGKHFNIYKIRSMHSQTSRISKFGRLIRSTKLDELPQFVNVLIGDMSIVGPRPDIPGYYDLLQGEERKILELKPGLTSPAALRYNNEEALLASQKDPISYNDNILFPKKVRMNLEYYHNRSFTSDLRIIFDTILSVVPGLQPTKKY